MPYKPKDTSRADRRRDPLNRNQLVSHPAGIGSSSWTGGRTLHTLQEERMDLAGRRTGLDVWLAW
jgi:hypothetical protein